ncbi:MAG: ACP S-malonyltransferase [Gammaproteobacteria bacterium]|nr:ACP S-malonyltransferase [Gammaproteobacteria bacterium]
MAIAFVFPGQGAQRVGMGADFLATDPVFRDRLEEANDALGFDLASIVLDGPASRLLETEVTQPALLTVGVALWQVWRARGGAMPAVMAGHSLGEYTAFTAAGSIAFADAVRLVNARGRFMQEAVPVGEGAMAAILGLDDDAVAECCEQVDGVAQPANLNAPGQVVISGSAPAVKAAAAACSEAGARRAVMLDVSAPFHSELMRPAADRFEAVLDAVNLRAPDVPVVHNLDASMSADAGTIKQKLLRQIDAPVRWTDCVTTIRDRGVDRLIECGPGNVLAGLVRRIDRSLDVVGIGTPGGMESGLESTASE